MHQPERNFRELVKIIIGLAAVSVAATALYFALYLLAYFIILRSGGLPQKLATGQLGTLLLLYCPAFLSSAISSWVMLRGAKSNVSGIVLRVIAVLSTVLAVAGALFLLPGSFWAWINLVLATVCFFLGSLTICVVHKSFD